MLAWIIRNPILSGALTFGLLTSLTAGWFYVQNQILDARNTVLERDLKSYKASYAALKASSELRDRLSAEDAARTVADNDRRTNILLNIEGANETEDTIMAPVLQSTIDSLFGSP